ncbi:hypothetical protein [Burkholderia sp. Leaf177]|uniref:hypothetical protein n=1 Tax=Burkholderia sp. Leaf177 TaxID=1736287 RepID=UPI0012E375D2|nr:hypothetical protein [Burkholderia sp. Leaf177]
MNVLQVRTMRDAFNQVKSIFAMHTSKALNLIFRDTFFDRSGALYNALETHLSRSGNEALSRRVSMVKV